MNKKFIPLGLVACAALVTPSLSTAAPQAKGGNAAFQAIDTNESQDISKSEAQRSENKELQVYFGKLDENGNGRLELSEFQNLDSVIAQKKAEAAQKAAKEKAEAAKRKAQAAKKKKKKQQQNKRKR